MTCPIWGQRILEEFLSRLSEHSFETDLCSKLFIPQIGTRAFRWVGLQRGFISIGLGRASLCYDLIPQGS